MFTNEELQVYLMRHVKRVSKDMKQKAYGRKHKQLFNIDDIEFKFHKFDEYSSTLGQYDEDDKITILISKELIENKKSLYRLDDKVLNTVGHELTHHLVSIDFPEPKENKLGFNRDSSPIFLSYLAWFGYSSGHKCSNNFKKSTLYKKVMNIKEFEVLEDSMINLYIDYKKAIRKLKSEIIGNTVITNNFEFGLGDTIGLDKNKVYVFDDLDTIQDKYISYINCYKIGCSVMPCDINRLYERKKYNLKNSRIYKGMFEDEDTVETIRNMFKNKDPNKAKILDYKLDKHYKMCTLQHVLGEGYVEDEDELETLRSLDLVKSITLDTEYECDYDYKYLIKLSGDKNIVEVYMEKN